MGVTARWLRVCGRAREGTRAGCVQGEGFANDLMKGYTAAELA